jgi:VanZ family protein
MERLRWLMWSIYLTVWTASLVTPYPIQASHAVLPAGAHFPASKTLHILGYAGLTALTAWLPVRLRLRWVLVALLPLHGALTELIQNFVPLRTGSWFDLGLDCIGVALGAAVVGRWLLLRRCRPSLD